MYKRRLKILIVDDSSESREALRAMLSESYRIAEADGGRAALELMEQYIHDYDLVLVDNAMPDMDGFAVLEYMREHGWLDYVPVIMLSSDSSQDTRYRAYAAGAADYILRPFTKKMLLQRVVNTVSLYARQRKLEAVLSRKISENDKTENLMTSILSHIVGYRNGESGSHVFGIKDITEVLLRELLREGGDVGFRYEDIPVLCHAATLHDIGKISIAEEILNKPGRLTPEEYEIMKTHSLIGAQMLESLPHDQDDPLIKAAHDICLYHHERYDGKGYPEGISGDAIPLSAQVVALADVYDALVSDRCYRKGFTHERAMEMILGGECGAFNPRLLDAFKRAERKLSGLSTKESGFTDEIKHSFNLKAENREELSETEDVLRQAQANYAKASFLASRTPDPVFSYREDPSMLILSGGAVSEHETEEVYLNPLDNGEELNEFNRDIFLSLIELSKRTTPTSPNFTFTSECDLKKKAKKCIFDCRTIYVSDPPKYYGFIGKMIKG